MYRHHIIIKIILKRNIPKESEKKLLPGDSFGGEEDPRVVAVVVVFCFYFLSCFLMRLGLPIF